MSLTVDTTLYSRFWTLTTSCPDAKDTLWIKKALQEIDVKGVTEGVFPLALLGISFRCLLAQKL